MSDNINNIRKALAENYVHSDMVFNLLVDAVVSNPRYGLKGKTHHEVANMLIDGMRNHSGRTIFYGTDGKPVSAEDGDFGGLGDYLNSRKADKAYLFTEEDVSAAVGGIDPASLAGLSPVEKMAAARRAGAATKPQPRSYQQWRAAQGGEGASQ